MNPFARNHPRDFVLTFFGVQLRLNADCLINAYFQCGFDSGNGQYEWSEKGLEVLGCAR